MDQTQKVLSDFGLNDKEIAVYRYCLTVDETSPFEVSKHTNIPRTTVYDVLNSLSLKGLVMLSTSDGFTKQQTKIKAINPSHLRTIIEKKRKNLSLLELNIIDILPSLKNDYHKTKSNTNIEYYEGIEGAKKIYMMGLDTDVPMYAFDNLMPMDAFGMKDINEDTILQTQTFITKNKRIKELVGLNDWTRHVLTYQVGKDKNYIKAREIRMIDNPIFEINQRIAIQGNKVRIICSHDDEVWGLVITSMSLGSTLRSLFLTLWQQATPITYSLVSSWGTNEMLAAENKIKESV